MSHQHECILCIVNAFFLILYLYFFTNYVIKLSNNFFKGVLLIYNLFQKFLLFIIIFSIFISIFFIPIIQSNDIFPNNSNKEIIDFTNKSLLYAN